jgi:hypothetical protein
MQCGAASGNVLIAQDGWIQVAVDRAAARELFELAQPEAAVEIVQDRD